MSNFVRRGLIIVNMGCFSMYNKMFLPDALLFLLRKSVMREKQKVSDLNVIHIPGEDLAVTKL